VLVGESGKSSSSVSTSLPHERHDFGEAIRFKKTRSRITGVMSLGERKRQRGLKKKKTHEEGRWRGRKKKTKALLKKCRDEDEEARRTRRESRSRVTGVMGLGGFLKKMEGVIKD
jgi:hypothetical protein